MFALNRLKGLIGSSQHKHEIQHSQNANVVKWSDLWFLLFACYLFKMNFQIFMWTFFYLKWKKKEYINLHKMPIPNGNGNRNVSRNGFSFIIFNKTFYCNVCVFDQLNRNWMTHSTFITYFAILKKRKKRSKIVVKKLRPI